MSRESDWKVGDKIIARSPSVYATIEAISLTGLVFYKRDGEYGPNAYGTIDIKDIRHRGTGE
jgi:hypothetical protein